MMTRLSSWTGLLGIACAALWPASGCVRDDSQGPSAEPAPRAVPTLPSESNRAAPSPDAGAGAAPGEADDDPLVPAITRAGNPRFNSASIHDHPAMAAVLLERLSHEPSSELRIALVEALPRTGGEWFDALLERYASEQDPGVRREMMAILPRARPEQAALGLLRGLSDADALVRAEAALAVGSAPEAARGTNALFGRLQELLQDTEPAARASAARSLGILGHGPSFSLLTKLLRDPSALVRLQAVRALDRLDRPRAGALADLSALQDDADAKVARAARRVVERARAHTER